MNSSSNSFYYQSKKTRHVYHSILQVVEENDAAKVVYVPTIYGPWQPETMSFEAAIRQKEVSEIESAIKAEDKSDALFISDIMEAVSRNCFTS